jgi:glycosyltransferase involved in cell wall biosynthesis
VDRGSFTPGTEPDGPPWRLLNVANLNAVKDHTTLLRAFKILIEAGLDGRLDIAGEDTLCGRTQALAEALGLGPRITFHGSLTTERLAQLYRHAHVFVLASRHEAAGVVALEAALCGLPIAGTAVGYVADWANDRAVAVPSADPPALADAVRGLLADQAKRRHIASEARRWALDHDSDWTADAFSRLYRSVAVL